MTSPHLCYITSSWILGTEPKFGILFLHEFCPAYMKTAILTVCFWLTWNLGVIVHEVFLSLLGSHVIVERTQQVFLTETLLLFGFAEPGRTQRSMFYYLTKAFSSGFGYAITSSIKQIDKMLVFTKTRAMYEDLHVTLSTRMLILSHVTLLIALWWDRKRNMVLSVLLYSRRGSLIRSLSRKVDF